MNINTQAKKKSHKRKFEGDENQHLHYSKSQKLVRERNRKAKLRKNPAMSIFEAGRERTKRIVKKEYPSINLNKPPSSIASLSNYTPRNKKAEEKSNKNDKDHKSTVYKRTTFRLPIREPSAQNFDMYYYLAPNREPATVTNILELYDETKSKLLEKKKAKASNNNNTKPILPKEPVLKNKENYINMANHHNKTNVLGISNKINKTSMSLSNKENYSEHPKKIGKENKGILTKSNMNATNILKSSKANKLKDGKANLVKTELDDNKENIPPLHHNQNTTVMNLQFVDYPSGNGNVGLTSVAKSTNEMEEKKENKTKLNKIKKEEEGKEEEERKEKEKDKEGIANKKENTKEDKPAQRKNKPIIVNTVSDEDLEEFFRVFDDLIPMYRSSTQLQEVIFETSQKEWNEWCYKVEQCEEETNSWLDARIMFYTRRIIEYKKDWTEYWNKKRKKEKEMLELTSDLSSDSLCPNTPSSVSLLSEPMKLLGSSPLPTLPPLTSPSSTFYIPPFQTPEDSTTSMLTSSETTPTKSTHGINISTSNAAFNNIFLGTDDLDLTTLSIDSNQDLLSNMSLLYDTTTTANGQPGYPNMNYDLNSTASYDSLDPLSNATLNSDYNSWLGSNPSSSLSMDDLLFNSTTTTTDPNISLLFNSLQSSTNTSGTDVTAAAAATIPTSLNFLNPLAATTAAAVTTLNPTLPLFDTNYTTPSSSNDQLLLPSSLMMKLPSVSSTASLIDSFANLNADSSKSEEEEEKEEKEKEKDDKEKEKGKENKISENSKTLKKSEKSKVEAKTKTETEAIKQVIKEKEEKEEKEVKMTEKEKDIKMEFSISTTTIPTETLVDQDMTSLLSKDLGFETLFENDLNAKVEQDKTIASTPKISTESSFAATTAMSSIATSVASNTTNSILNTFTAKELFKTDETPKMDIKAVTDTLITPTKPKEMNQTIDFFVDNTLTTGNKNHSEFVTPLYIKPPAAMDTLSSIPKSYQEMYNDKMCSLISTLERCVQDKEDFWKVMEEFTSSIITRSSPISTAC